MVEEYVQESVSVMFSLDTPNGLVIVSQAETKTCVSTLEFVCICQANPNA